MSIPPDRPAARDPQHTPPNSIPWWRRSWVIAAAAFVVGAGIAGAAASRGSSKTVAGPTVRTVHTTITVPPTWITTTAHTVTVPWCDLPNTKACAAQGFTAGWYLVGSEIVPLTYHTDGGVSCYYARLRNPSGDPSAIIASKHFEDATTVKVEPTDYALQLTGTCIWAPAGVSRVGAQ